MNKTEKIESAVYSYIQAMRTLDHKNFPIGLICLALGITQAQALKAVKSLKDMGVKLT